MHRLQSRSGRCQPRLGKLAAFARGARVALGTHDFGTADGGGVGHGTEQGKLAIGGGFGGARFVDGRSRFRDGSLRFPDCRPAFGQARAGGAVVDREEHLPPFDVIARMHAQIADQSRQGGADIDHFAGRLDHARARYARALCQSAGGAGRFFLRFPDLAIGQPPGDVDRGEDQSQHRDGGQDLAGEAQVLEEAHGPILLPACRCRHGSAARPRARGCGRRDRKCDCRG